MSVDPVALVQHWQEMGARAIHLVNQEGVEESFSDRDWVRNIVTHLRIPVHVEGGIRSQKDVDALLQAGVSRVLLGTRAWTDSAWLKGILAQYGSRIGVCCDVANGRLWLYGGTRPGPWLSVALAVVQQLHVPFLLLTSIGATERHPMVRNETLRVIRHEFTGVLHVAGKFTSRVELRQLAQAEVDGAVMGRALYDGTLSPTILKEEF